MRRESFIKKTVGLVAMLGLISSTALADTIFTDSFATSTLGSAWTTNGTGNWRVRLLTTYRVGSTGYGAAMDDSVAGGYSTTRLNLKLNLAGYSGVTLNFKMRNVGDESHTQDGVYISADGVNFYKVAWSFPAIGSTWSTHSLNLSSAAATAGITLGVDSVIRFQEYDDYSLSSDGIAIDDVTVTGTIAAPAVSSRPGIGAIPYTSGSTSGTTFRVWAPNGSAVSVAGEFNGWLANRHPLASEGGSGNWSVDVPGALISDEYKYVITYSGTQYWRQDPRAEDMTNDAGNSIVADKSHTWANSFTMPGWNELVIYESHVGTYYRSNSGTPGTFADMQSKLQHLQDLGINAIQLMPIMEFPGMTSWGYNPHSQFAPESDYGTPKQLKQLVDAAHGRGMAVIMDVVYNHMGPARTKPPFPSGTSTDPNFGNGGIYFYTD